MSPEMWTEPWYRALIENARDDAGELGRIEQFLQASAKLPVGQREELVRLIGDYLRTANPGRPPRSEGEAMLWADASRCIHDTTAYDESATEHVLTFIGGPGWIPGAMQTPTGTVGGRAPTPSRSCWCSRPRPWRNPNRIGEGVLAWL
jgi:hypothetical protein